MRWTFDRSEARSQAAKGGGKANVSGENPTQLSEGVKYVFVNRQLEFENGKLTETKAGRVLHGPGWEGRRQ